MKKILIVGSGFAGSVIARILADEGHLVEIIDKRDHIGGNAYDYTSEEGIRIHKYGPHIFHTNNERVFDWLSGFTNWIDYKHKVKALLSDGSFVTLPPNMETAEILGKENIVDILFRPYTKKMWGLDIEELDSSILQRVPIRDDLNELYFPNDKYQVMPKDGYTQIFYKLLDSANINVKTSTDFKKGMEDEYDHVFNSMPIDEYYDFKYGELPYRSIKFKNVVLESPSLLPVPTINFTHDGPWTRVTEWKKYPNHGVNNYKTVLTFEEPCDYKENDFERYYPVKDISGHNRKKYEMYKNLSEDKMTFIGRCGLYVYLDMHQAISSSMAVAKRYLKNL